MNQPPYNILFVCVHNSARSQMAEAFLNKLGGGRFKAESAGLAPGKLNPYVVEVMVEVDIDISQNKTKAVVDLLRQQRPYDAVITVCDLTDAEQCPVFPGVSKRIAWFFPDPARFLGTHEQIIAQTRHIRDEIHQKVVGLIQEAGTTTFNLSSDHHKFKNHGK